MIAICDAAKERSPIFPFTLNFRHWSIVDPNTAVYLPDQRTEMFRRVRDEIKNEVKQFIIDSAEIAACELSIA